MAELVDVQPFPLWFPAAMATPTGVLLDANSEKAAWVGFAPKTGSIDRAIIRLGTVTTGETVDVRLETVGADGNPSGTLFGTNTNASLVVALTDDDIWPPEVTFTAAASVTRGDRIALVVAFPAIATGNLNLERVATGESSFPYTSTFAAAAWTRAAGSLLGGLRYSDGNYARTPSLVPYRLANNNYNNTSSPDERGNLITVPGHCKCSGLWVVNGSTSTLGDFDAVLYDINNNVLESVSMDGDLTAVTSGVNIPFFCPFDTEVTLQPGQQVRAIKKPTSATNVNQSRIVAPSSSAAEAMPGGSAMVRTARTDAGTWSQTANEQAGIGLLISAIPRSGESARSFAA